ncbi:MAG: hypothetical protein ACK56F_07725, partial [bacterium]
KEKMEKRRETAATVLARCLEDGFKVFEGKSGERMEEWWELLESRSKLVEDRKLLRISDLVKWLSGEVQQYLRTQGDKDEMET